MVDPGYASALREMHVQVSGLIVQQFRRTTALVLLSVASIVVVYSSMLWLGSKRGQSDSTAVLRRANEDLVNLLASSVASSEEKERFLAAAEASRAASNRILDELDREASSLPPEGLSILQLLGGSAVLALLGYLGLQRLQNLDAEINNLRDFMFRQIKERVEEGREVLKASIDEDIEARVVKTLEQLEAQIRTTREQTQQATASILAAATDATDKVTTVEQRAAALFERYRWLEDDNVRTSANALNRLASAAQAHTAATRFREAGEHQQALVALSRIPELHLPGAPDEYHNSHIEASNLADPLLSLRIVEEGLAHFPDHFDLMPDKAQALINCGRQDEAKRLLEDWRQRKPNEFARSWRAVVFYAEATLAGEVTSEIEKALVEAFDDVTNRQPYFDKVWSMYVRFAEGRGKLELARDIALRALAKNPYSQELNYVLGKIFLTLGEPQEAVERFQAALRVDYQDQYQHDVNQLVLRGALAQAFEALGEPAKARTLYEGLTAGQGHISRFAKNRLVAIAALEGQVVKGDVDMDVLTALMASLGAGRTGARERRDESEEGIGSSADSGPDGA